MKAYPKIIFVTGTDTGAGKTVLSLLLIKYFYTKGKKPFYLKPFQTGCITANDKDSDAFFIYKNTTQLNGKDPSRSTINIYREPKSPYFAALNEGRPITSSNIDSIITYTNSLITEHSPLIIEGAGGVLVPVTIDIAMIDMIKLLSATPVIASRASVGTINHTLLTINALKAEGLTPAGIIMLCETKINSNDTTIMENIQIIETKSGIKVAGVIEHIDDFSNVNENHLKIIDSLFR